MSDSPARAPREVALPPGKLDSCRGFDAIEPMMRRVRETGYAVDVSLAIHRLNTEGQLRRRPNAFAIVSLDPPDGRMSHRVHVRAGEIREVIAGLQRALERIDEIDQEAG